MYSEMRPENSGNRPNTSDPGGQPTAASTAQQPDIREQYLRAWRRMTEGSVEAGALAISKLIKADPTPLFAPGRTDDMAYAARVYAHIKMLSDLGRGTMELEVTPALAKLILRHNPNNRYVVPGNLASLYRSLSEGGWQVNGETVIIANNGVLNDGQHRLYACILSGVTITTMIAYGVAPETRKTVDIGVKRQPGDRLVMSGVESGFSQAACNALVFITIYNRRAGDVELDQFFAENQEKLVRADKLAKVSRAKPSLAMWNGAVFAAAAFHLLHGGASEANVEAFYQAFSTGEGLKIGSPILALRNAFGGKKSLSREQRVRSIIAHYNAWRRNRTLRHLQLSLDLPDVEVR